MNWNKYPYTDFHELNLDWILDVIRTLEKTVENFVNYNEIKFHDPISWNITTQYEKNTVVANSGVAYLSKQPVPSGISLNNAEYWLEIGNFGIDADVIRENIAIHNEGTGIVASAAYIIDDLMWWNSNLYIVTSPIIEGQAIAIGTNVERITVEDYIKKITLYLENNIVENVTTLNEKINNVAKYKTPEQYGAVGDGITDDTEAFKSLFNELNNYDVVILTKGYYVIKDSLEINNDFISVCGYGSSEFTPSLRYTGDNGKTILTVNGTGCTINNIGIIDRSSTQLCDLLFFNADNEIYNGNIDGKITGCVFIYGNEQLKCKGRNLNVFDSLFSSCSGPGIHIYQTEIDTDNRGFIIDRNRFHSINNLCISNGIDNSRNGKYIKISNNFADYCSRFYEGYGCNVVISSNYIFQISGSCITLNRNANVETDDKLWVDLIENNYINGQGANAIGIQLVSNLKRCIVKGNMISYLNYAAIRLRSTVDCEVVNNVLYKCGVGDGQHPIYSDAGCYGVCAFNRLKDCVNDISVSSGVTNQYNL